MMNVLRHVFILIALVGLAACSSGNASENTTKEVIFTSDAPEPVGPYSQGILFGSTLYCAGQIGIDPSTGTLVEGGAASEADQALKNLGAVLQAANMDYGDVVMATVFLTDLNDYSAVNEIYAMYFASDAPARQAVAVSTIPGSASVEISLIAMKTFN